MVMTTGQLLWRQKTYFRGARTTTANFIKFYFKFIAVSQIQFRDSFDSDKQSKWLKSISRFEGEI